MLIIMGRIALGYLFFIVLKEIVYNHVEEDLHIKITRR